MLGPTDPKEVPEDSLRGLVLKRWKELVLKEGPNVGVSGVHAIASPFKGLRKRINRLGYRAGERSMEQVAAEGWSQGQGRQRMVKGSASDLRPYPHDQVIVRFP